MLSQHYHCPQQLPRKLATLCAQDNVPQTVQKHPKGTVHIIPE